MRGHSTTPQWDGVVTGEERPQTPLLLEGGRGLGRPPIAAYQGQHLPLVQAYADTIGVVAVIQQLVPTAMAIDPGPIVLGMLLDTLSGRSPLSRLAACFPAHATALLWGQAGAPGAFADDPVGRS